MRTTADEPDRVVYSVTELAEILRATVEHAVPSIWVRGEILNFSRPTSGHWYFTLKDAQAQLRCAMFRGSNFYVRPQPKDGDRVLVRGRVSLYPARGDLQLVCEHLEPAGAGALLAAFEALKNRLAKQGLFDERLKRPLPAMPRHVGLITSETGAALHDVLATLSRRWPLAAVTLYAVPVQGTLAAPAICRALDQLPRRAPVDVILLVRGGGALEDLWAFNDESVALALRACGVPVVSGIGHEIDVTIADFAADLRAATPTAAAERAVPDVQELKLAIAHLRARLQACWRQRMSDAGKRLAQLSTRVAAQHPRRRLQLRSQAVDEREIRLRRAARRQIAARGMCLQAADQRLRATSPMHRMPQYRLKLERRQLTLRAQMSRILEIRRARLARAHALLESLSPHAVLGRGYAVVRDHDGRVLREARALAINQVVEVQLARGEFQAQVHRIRTGNSSADD